MKQENTNNHDSYPSIQKFLVLYGNRFRQHTGSLQAMLRILRCIWLVESQTLLHRRWYYNLELALHNRKRAYYDNGPCRHISACSYPKFSLRSGSRVYQRPHWFYCVRRQCPLRVEGHRFENLRDVTDELRGGFDEMTLLARAIWQMTGWDHTV